MTKEKRYRLLKDLPDLKAGSEVIYWNSHYRGIINYCDGVHNDYYFSRETVEDNPDWFEEIKPASCKKEKELSSTEILEGLIKALDKLLKK